MQPHGHIHAIGKKGDNNAADKLAITDYKTHRHGYYVHVNILDGGPPARASARTRTACAAPVRLGAPPVQHGDLRSRRPEKWHTPSALWADATSVIHRQRSTGVVSPSTSRTQGCCPFSPQGPSSMVIGPVDKSPDIELLARHAETAASLLARAQLEDGWELDHTPLGDELAHLLDLIARGLHHLHTGTL